MTSPRYLQNDLLAYLHAQLPRAVAEKIKSIDVHTDPFHIRTFAVFVDQAGRSYKILLDKELIAGVELACKIPEEFIARLCVSV